MNSTMVIALVAMVLAIVFLTTVRTAMSKSNRIDERRRNRGVGQSFIDSGVGGHHGHHDGGWGGFDGGSGFDGGGSGGGDGGGGGGS